MMKLKYSILAFLDRHPLIKGILYFPFRKSFPVFLEYHPKPKPRYGHGLPPHQRLYEIVNKNREVYKNYLNLFLKNQEQLLQVPKNGKSRSSSPYWINGWLPGLDAVAIYGFLSHHNPKRYFEIGSGNSTKFARQAIKDHTLQTQMTSIDPTPRAEIDSLCDNVIRRPLEDVNLEIFSQLEAGDMLFVDSSHRSFMNSDVTVLFLEILHELKPGILVEFHDILIPYDYPQLWSGRFYSEQYLLATYLLASDRFEVVFPAAFINEDKDLKEILTPFWSEPRMSGIERHGGSFWIKLT